MGGSNDLESVKKLVREVAEWATEEVQDIYIRKCFRRHYISNRLNDPTRSGSVYAIDVLDDPSAFHGVAIGPTRWPKDVNFNYMSLLLKKQLHEINPRLDPAQRDTMVSNAYRMALNRFYNFYMPMVEDNCDFQTKVKKARQYIIVALNSNMENFDSILMSLFETIKDEYCDIEPGSVKPNAIAVFKMNKSVHLVTRKNTRKKWEHEELLVLQNAIAESTVDGKINKVNIVKIVKQSTNRDDEQIRSKLRTMKDNEKAEAESVKDRQAKKKKRDD